MTKVSVMMLSYNRLAFSQATVKYLFEGLDYPIEKFVWVDNGSTDGTVVWAKQFLTDLPNQNSFVKSTEFIENEINKGIAVGQNQGAKACAEDSDVVMVSNDIFAGKNWLSPLVKCVERHRDLGIQLGWVSPYMAPEHQFDDHCNEKFRKDYFDYWYRRILNCNDPDSLYAIMDELYQGDFQAFSQEFVKRNAGKIWDEAVSMMFYWTREAINEVGYFDERFSEFYGHGGWGSEDVDLMVRMNAKRFFRLTCFDSWVHHVICATTRKIVLDSSEFAYGDIETGNKFLRLWCPIPNQTPVYYPLDIIPQASKRAYDTWLRRKHNLDFGDLTKLDLGLTKEEQETINKTERESQGVCDSK